MEYRRCTFLLSVALFYLAKPTASSKPLVVVTGNEYDITRGLWCPTWMNKICGSDGITYWNSCIFLANKEKKGLKIVKHGSCEKLDCEDCLAENSELFEVCGSNAQTFKSFCEFECYVETYPHLTEVEEHCPSGFPSQREMELATPDIYGKIFEAYSYKYKEVIDEFSLNNVLVPKFSFQADINNNTVRVTCTKITVGEFSKLVMPFNNIYFYSLNDVYGRTKFVFEFEKLTIRIKRLRALGLGLKFVGRADLIIEKNLFEMIVDLRSSPGENYCPILHPVSFRIVDANNISVRLVPPAPGSAEEYRIEGLIREKAIELINEKVIPKIFEKLFEIPCLIQTNSSVSCYGFFQSKICF